MTLAAAALFFLAGVGASGSNKPEPRHGQAFLAVHLRPEVAARTLLSVEDEWQAQATVFAECSNATSPDKALVVDCHQAPLAFGKSCDAVVQAVVQGSNGKSDAVQEYLDDVCGQMVLQGWHEDRCRSFSNAIENMMTQKSYENRMHLNVGSLCSGLWSQLLQEEEEHVKKKRADEEARAKIRAEEEVKAAAEAKARAEEETKAEEEARAQEEKATEEAAAQEDEEAKAKSNAKEEGKVGGTKLQEEEARGKAGGKGPEAEQVNATVETHDKDNANGQAKAKENAGTKAQGIAEADVNATAKVVGASAEPK
mmetsp:Transcript_102118/g.288396  ORF Transcript_102118/g.288396 Transcript_102118/m.288396 type:complete len:311 (-) Transcript_102118:60-992(-)